MLAVSHSRSTVLPPPVPRRVMDQSGTINPAALNTPGSSIPSNLLVQPSPRGTKRSRSPGPRGSQSLDSEAGAEGSTSKRSRQNTETASAHSQMPSYTNQMQPVQTPQTKAQSLPQASPSHTSPQRSTPGSGAKPAVVKALPTVRDHTTDQLGPEGDEYIPRETDPDGETKVSKDGYALDGRKYKCRTFQVPNRGEKLFMLATECARVLGYRDSYLLFNKNRSLFKIIANQAEKDNLIQQDILPYSYRSRQIAIVTARSMFRQFGSRLIEGGRRVRDDYWEAKAKKQGFTEEDAAGEKRPGAAKAREAAAAEANQSTTTLTSLPQGEIIYANGPSLESQAQSMLQPVSLAPLPMIHIAGDDHSAFGNMIRPRQEISGPPYQDRIQAGNPTEILTQTASAADFNKQLAQTRTHRSNYLDEYWRRPHEQPSTEPPPGAADLSSIVQQSLQSPQNLTNLGVSRPQQDSMSHTAPQMLPQGYPGYPNQHNPSASPVQAMHRPMQSAQMHHGSPSLNMGSSHRQTPSYGYSSNQMWSTPQPQPSPLTQPQHGPYGQQQQQHPPQQQQQQQQQPQPQTPQQTQMPPPQMHQQPGLNYGQLNQISNPAFGGGMNRNMYQTAQGPQQFSMGPQQNAGGQPPGMQGWTNPGGNVPDWQRY